MTAPHYRGLVLAALLAACGCDRGEPERGASTAGAGRTDAGRVARRSKAPADAGGKRRGSDGAPAASPVPTSGVAGVGASEAEPEEWCCRGSIPSYPAVTLVEGQPWIAYYDGEETVVATAPPGRETRVPRPMPVGRPPPAGPALVSSGSSVLLLSVATAGMGYELLARRMPLDLADAGRVVHLARNVDARYTPGIVPVPDGFLVAWVDTSGETGRAMVGKIRADGDPTGTPRLLSPAASGAGSIALGAGPSGVVAAWIDPRLGFSPVYVARGRTDGTFEDAEIALSTGSVSGTPLVSVAAGSGASALVAWGHMGPLGQDYLSRAYWRHGESPPSPAPLSRMDAYGALRAVALRASGGFAVLWDEPTEQGREPPTVVRLERLDGRGSPVGERSSLGDGDGVAAVVDGARLVAAIRRGTSICVQQLTLAGTAPPPEAH